MIFLSEVDDNIKMFSESKTENGDLYLEGITLVANIKNANKRIYPKNVLLEAIQHHSEKFLKEGRAVGELNHPTENISQINYNNVSHRFLEIREDGNNFITKAKVLNTISGKQVQNLHEGGVKLGISSRAFGNTKFNEKENATIIENLYIVSFGDIVANPSAPGAFVDSVVENKEFLWKNGQLIENDLEEDLDGYKKIIHNSKKNERVEIFSEIFKNYMKSLTIPKK
jgi:hypothetical protein